MNENLLIKSGSNLMNRLTSLSGNIDVDKITPSIWISQVTDIQRVLTPTLYNKILNDFSNNTLDGQYLEIYNEYVSTMLIFYATSDFILKNSVHISNGGDYQNTLDKVQQYGGKENERLSKYYTELGLHFEMKFYQYMKDKTIPEYERLPMLTIEAYKFPWYI